MRYDIKVDLKPNRVSFEAVGGSAKLMQRMGVLAMNRFGGRIPGQFTGADAHNRLAVVFSAVAETVKESERDSDPECEKLESVSVGRPERVLDSMSSSVALTTKDGVCTFNFGLDN